MNMEFRTLHSRHQRPIPDGFRRCWAVVPPSVIEALLREERFAPTSHDVQFPRERSSCHACTSPDGWCYHQARCWVVDCLATVVGQDGLEAPSGFMPAAASRLMQVGLTISLTAFLSWLMCPKIGCCGFMPIFSEKSLWPVPPSSIRRSSAPKQGGFPERT